MQVSIVIVHFNTPELTKNCIASVLEKTSEVTYEIIVVDNASTTHNSDELKELYPKINLIKSAVNLGFAGGNNLGIKAASGEYILLLNSDTVLINDAISLSYQYSKQNKRIGVVSAQLLYPDGRIQSVCQRFPSVRYSLIEFFRLQKLLSGQKRGRLLLGAFFDHQSGTTADWVWGAFFMFPSKILQQLPDGKLDEHYFMYAEDMQWCMDIKRLGYAIHYYPEAKVLHFMGGSSGAKSALMQQSGKLFLKKNYNPLHRFILGIVSKIV